jgi:trans-L-3-hydroxyproline dehydratase
MTLQPPDWAFTGSWTRLSTVDAHTAGEPFRVVTSGWPPLPGESLVARRRYAIDHHDHLRRALMWEPRGHADMYGCVITPPVSQEADVGVLFMHNEGFSTMCGHGIIGLVTVLLETRMLQPREPDTPVAIDTPAGLVRARAAVSAGRVPSVTFRNVPAFVLVADRLVEVAGLGAVRVDVAFGGAFYAYVRAEDLGLTCTPGDLPALVTAAARIKAAVSASIPIVHPFEPELSFLYGVVFNAPASRAGADIRNVCVFADGEVDRSPTGTSVSAQLALLHARHSLGIGERLVFESILGTRFGGRVTETTTFGPHAAVVPEVEGTAHLTGRHEFVLDPEDALAGGFLLRRG